MFKQPPIQPGRGNSDFAGIKSIGRRQIFVYGFFGLVIALLMAYAIYTTIQYQALKKNPAVTNEDTNKRILTSLGKILKLPDDESPQVAAVEDKSKLGSDVFFKDVENGDFLVVYSKARRIIVYRESNNQIINQGPFVINTAGKVKVALLKATKSDTTFETAQQQIRDKLGDTLGVLDTNTLKVVGTYRKSQVIDLTGGQRTDVAKSIASAINGELIAKLPDGEPTPQDAEVVVVVAP